MKWHTNTPAADAPNTKQLDADGFGASFAPQAQQHLVVETRTDDRWRVAFCTTLDDLDTALDTTKILHADTSIDEVCLTLETTGTRGREMRREILRLGHETATVAPTNTTSAATPAPAAPPRDETDAVLNVLLPSIKAPDYTIDDAVLDALQPRPALRSLATAEADLMIEAESPEPARRHQDAPSEAEARAAAQALVRSLYGLGGKTDDGSDNETGDGNPPSPREGVIDFSCAQPDPDETRRVARLLGDHPPEAAEPPPPDISENWIEGIEAASHQRFAGSDRLEAADKHADAPGRLTRSLMGETSGVATKALIVAGTLAMMVLGGSLAELMAFNVTPSAMAGQTPPPLSQPLD